MVDQVRGLFEVSIDEATASIAEHAKCQGIAATDTRVKGIICKSIKDGTLKPVQLIQDLNRQIDTSETMMDPRVFLEYGQAWLCEHGLHREPGTNDYPRFPTFETDYSICEWLEGVLPELRAGMMSTYEPVDYKAHRVELVLAAMLCPDNEEEHSGDSLHRIREVLRAQPRQSPVASKDVALRAETTYLNIIGALLDLLLGKSPAGRPVSTFENQAAVIDALLSRHNRKPGIAERTLEEKFAAAKRSLAA